MTAMSPQIRSLPTFLPSTKFGSSQTTSFEHLTERLSSKRLLTVGQCASKNTVEKLSKLLKMELKNAIEENPNLDKDVFPDESIPAVIDGALIDRLLPPGQLKKFNPRRAVKAWRGKKSILANPPSLWSEENIAAWMNDIGNSFQGLYELENKQIALGAYIDAHGINVASTRRIWTHKHAGAILDGSSIPRKPDTILLDQNSLNSPTWSKVRALCEVTVTERNKSKTIKDTILQKSYIMFMTQANRRFVPSLSFTCDSFTLTICDRAGVVSSATMKVVDNPLILLRIIVCLMFGRPSAIGYDETIRCNEEGKATSVWVNRREYKVEEELFKSDSMRGRATRCWRVSTTDSENGIGEEFVIKDSWADTRRTQSEILMLNLIQSQGLCNGKGIPKLIDGEDICVPIGTHYIKDSTACRRVPGGHTEERVHRRLVMGPVGKHITNFKTLKELIGAFIDIVKGMSRPIVNSQYTDHCASSARRSLDRRDST